MLAKLPSTIMLISIVHWVSRGWKKKFEKRNSKMKLQQKVAVLAWMSDKGIGFEKKISLLWRGRFYPPERMEQEREKKLLRESDDNQLSKKGKRVYRSYKREDKERFFFLIYEKNMGVKEVDRTLKMPGATAQSWYKSEKERILIMHECFFFNCMKLFSFDGWSLFSWRCMNNLWK